MLVFIILTHFKLLVLYRMHEDKSDYKGMTLYSINHHEYGYDILIYMNYKCLT